MGTTRSRTDPDDPSTFPTGRIDPAAVDATAEADIALQEREDDAAARVLDKAPETALRVLI